MRRIYLFLIFFLMLHTHSGTLKGFFSDYFVKCKIISASISSLVCNSYQFNIFGTKDVSQKTDSIIQGILQELGLPHYDKIHIKQMSSLLVKIAGKKNALATANAIYIDEELFLTLSSSEQQALIGHEGIHIKNRDILRSIFFILLVDITIYKSFSWSEKNIKNMFVQGTFNSSVFIALLFFSAAFSRYQEQCADKESADKLGCHEGGIKLVEHFLKKSSNEPQEKHYFYRLKKWFAKIVAAHPSRQERIAYFAERIQN